jgi:hypothetical protein
MGPLYQAGPVALHKLSVRHSPEYPPRLFGRGTVQGYQLKEVRYEGLGGHLSLIQCMQPDKQRVKKIHQKKTT